MLKKNSLIFVVDDDPVYGKLVQAYLNNQGFEDVLFFDDETECLHNMHKCPQVLVLDYTLKSMNGLRLMQEAWKIHSGFYSILLSGTYHLEYNSDDVALRYVDKYILKSNNALEELNVTMKNWLAPSFAVHYY